MKKHLYAFMMSMSMFCVIPLPFKNWDEKLRPLSTLFIPFVGLFIGCLWVATAYLLKLIKCPALVCGAILCAFPYVITGGIHIDGFLDTVDALKSWRDLEERRRILKDPHVGSFAVINTVMLILLQFSFLASLKSNANIFALLVIPVVSRELSAFFVTVLRPISVSEYSGAYQKGIKKTHLAYLIFLFAVTVFLCFVFFGKYGWVSVAVAVGYLFCLIRAFRSLDGMSGDVAGYALTFGELCGIALFVMI